MCEWSTIWTQFERENGAFYVRDDVWLVPTLVPITFLLIDEYRMIAVMNLIDTLYEPYMNLM